MCFNDQRKEESKSFVFGKDSGPIRMDFEVRIFPNERPHNSLWCGHGHQKWTCGLPGRVQRHRRPLCLRSTALREIPIVLFLFLLTISQNSAVNSSSSALLRVEKMSQGTSSMCKQYFTSVKSYLARLAPTVMVPLTARKRISSASCISQYMPPEMS